MARKKRKEKAVKLKKRLKRLQPNAMYNPLNPDSNKTTTYEIFGDN